MHENKRKCKAHESGTELQGVARRKRRKKKKMATTLKFNKEGDTYVARFMSEGNIVVQLEREKWGVVSVLASVGGLEPTPIAEFQNGYKPNVIFSLNVPSGVEITIKSQTEVKEVATLVAQ